MCGLGDFALLLDRRIPLWQKEISGEFLRLRQPVGNNDDVNRQPLNNWNLFSSIDLTMRFRTSWSERLSFQRATLSYLSATIDILLMTMTCRFIIGEGQGQIKI